MDQIMDLEAWGPYFYVETYIVLIPCRFQVIVRLVWLTVGSTSGNTSYLQMSKTVPNIYFQWTSDISLLRVQISGGNTQI